MPHLSQLVFIGFRTISAWGEQGLLWETEPLSSDSISTIEISGEELRGSGWDALAGKEAVFSVDLATGKRR